MIIDPNPIPKTQYPISLLKFGNLKNCIFAKQTQFINPACYCRLLNQMYHGLCN
jgi:hypothetical protein